MIYSSQNLFAKKTSHSFWVLGMFNSQTVYGNETEAVASGSGPGVFYITHNRFYRMRRAGSR